MDTCGAIKDKQLAISRKIPSVSVRSLPFSSITIPFGVAWPSLIYFSILPRWLIDVAPSIIKSKASSLGIPKQMGLVPMQG